MIRCPCCGADMVLKGRINCCEYCGYEERDKGLASNSNLIITCSAVSSSSVRIVIKDAAITHVLREKETAYFNLVPGPHEVIFEDGGVTEKRIVVISSGDMTVKIDYSPSKITVDQPREGSATYEIKEGKPTAQKNGLTLAAMIMACMGLVVPVFIMAGINIRRAKKAGLRPNTLDRFAIGLVISFWVVLIMLFAIGLLGGTS